MSQSEKAATAGLREWPSEKLDYAAITDTVLDAMRPPSRRYYVWVTVLALVVAAAFSAWIYQVRVGMVVTGVNHPVGWGCYIGNFVFWVGIAHSGTLISAILHLVRARWRNAVSRSAEAMTIFAVLTAGLFPLIHLGRLWVFYYIIPYPSERQLWPNFTSALVWDFVAVSTYLTVSVIFFYVGMLPDLASVRDRAVSRLGPDHIHARIYRWLALGWSGTAHQWRHYGRSYLYFAALATPLVISVHSVVSWDFAMGLLPGWHSAVFPPYFVAGAIHSGLAMVLVLMIPMRRWLRLESLVTIEHFDALAQTMLLTTAIVAYAYVVEPFISWYSGDLQEWQFTAWRATGHMAWMYWALIPLNVLAPLAFVFRRVRRNFKALFTVAILVTVGMWIERYFIVVGSTSHDFLPHNWGPYHPSWVEWTITAGSFAWFMFWFLLFSKTLPVIPAGEMKGLLAEGQTHDLHVRTPLDAHGQIARSRAGVLAIFPGPEPLLLALRGMHGSSFRQLETLSPVKVGEVEQFLGLSHGPIRYWTFFGALSGCIGGLWLASGTAGVNGLIVGGKSTPVAWIPYCIVAFEGTILMGTLANLTGLIVHARLGPQRALPAAYDPAFSRDKFGLFVSCEPARLEEAKRELARFKPEEIRVIHH